MNVLPSTSFLLLVILSVFPMVAFAQRYVISTDEQEVTDTKTGLVWRRCAAGMTFSNGTCNGTASGYSHESALTYAASESKTMPWRLPNVKELASIVDRGVINPAIDSSAFPATPTGVFWSASPFLGFNNGGYARVVVFDSGLLDYDARNNTNYVRLVRVAQ